MKIAIIGGGLVGCLVALELAERGQSVVLLEQEASLISRASANNEGKLHLGYVYGADPSFETAQRLILDALVFRPILERWITPETFERCLSAAFNYIVPLQSRLPLDAIQAHLARVDAFCHEQECRLNLRYLGQKAQFEPRAPEKCRETGATWLSTPERGIWAKGVARAVAACVTQHPKIEVRYGVSVHNATSSKGQWRIQCDRGQPGGDGPYDAVINAAWSGRRTIDRASGFASAEPWYARFKYGVLLRDARAVLGQAMPSNTTATSGAFGDSVYYPDVDVLYCSWYPVGMCFASRDESLNAADPTPEQARRMIHDTYAGYASIDPAYSALSQPHVCDKAELMGDYIVARGHSDIVDPHSILHERRGHGPKELAPGYFSVDTGKYTSAPRCAVETVDALLAKERACLVS